VAHKTASSNRWLQFISHGGQGRVLKHLVHWMCGVLCVVWCVVCGVWCVVCGVWCVVCGVWCGVWCVGRLVCVVRALCGQQ
jgi:hypothetical protein